MTTQTLERAQDKKAKARNAEHNAMVEAQNQAVEVVEGHQLDGGIDLGIWTELAVSTLTSDKLTPKKPGHNTQSVCIYSTKKVTNPDSCWEASADTDVGVRRIESVACLPKAMKQKEDGMHRQHLASSVTIEGP